ncbi:hypothetical protein HRR76_002959, partial [Exophiala dermatitidis]
MLWGFGLKMPVGVVPKIKIHKTAPIPASPAYRIGPPQFAGRKYLMRFGTQFPRLVDATLWSQGVAGTQGSIASSCMRLGAIRRRWNTPLPHWSSDEQSTQPEQGSFGLNLGENT